MPKKSSKKETKVKTKKDTKVKSKKELKEVKPEKHTESNSKCLIDETINNDDKMFGNKTDLEEEKLVVDDIIKKEDRISKDRLTRYEMVRIISERTKQLTMGAKPLIKNHSSLTYEQIAIEEIKNNMVPFRIKRPINGKYEIWDLDELKKDHLIAYLK